MLLVGVHLKGLLILIVHKQGYLVEILVPYDLVLYSLFSNSLRNDYIDLSHGQLNVSKATNAWYFVTVESFLYNLLRWLVIKSTQFSLAMSFSGISKTTSCASSSRDKTKARPWHFFGNSVYKHQILKQFSQSSYVFDWESAGGMSWN